MGRLFGAGLVAALSLCWPGRPASADISDGIRLRWENSLAAVANSPISVPAAGSTIAKADLARLAELALVAQPAILIANARARADSERLEQARGGLRPNLSGSLGHGREFANSGLTVPFSSVNGGVLLSVPLFNPQADASIGQARFQEISSRSALAEAEQDILFRIVDAFIAAAQADEESGLLDLERAVLLDQRSLNQRRMDGGVGTRVELIETSARAAGILAQMETVRNVYRSQLAELGRLSGVTVEGVTRIRNRLPPLVVPERAEDAFAVAREKSSALTRLDASLSAAKAGIEVQRAALEPTVSLVGNLDRTRVSSAGATNFIPSAGLGVQVAIPIYTGGIVASRIRETQALADGAQAQFDDAASVIETELRKAYLDLRRTTEQWRIQVGVLATANESLEATRKAFDAGARTNIDLLNSQQLTFSIRRELLRARAGMVAAQIRILALSGTLNIPALARLGAAFEHAGTQTERSTP